MGQLITLQLRLMTGLLKALRELETYLVHVIPEWPCVGPTLRGHRGWRRPGELPTDKSQGKRQIWDQPACFQSSAEVCHRISCEQDRSTWARGAVGSCWGQTIELPTGADGLQYWESRGIAGSSSNGRS